MLRDAFYFFVINGRYWALFPLLALALWPWRRSVAQAAWDLAALRMAQAGVLAIALAAAIYPFLPGFFDGVEPVIASISYAVLNGQPMYPPPGSGYETAIPYGAALYLLQGASMALLPVLLGAKLPFALAGLVGLWLMFRIQARDHGPSDAWFGAAALALACMGLGAKGFVARGDSLLVLAGVASVWVQSRAPRWAPLALGLLAFFAGSVKLHGMLYVFPAWCWMLGVHGGRGVLISVLTALGAYSLPFLHPGVDWAGYRAVMAFAAELSVKLPDWEWRDSILAGAFLAFLPLGAFVGMTPIQRRAEAWSAFCLGLALLLAVIVSSRPASGPTHLLPLLPALLWAQSRWRRIAPARGSEAYAKSVWLLTLALIGSLHLAVVLRAGRIAFDPAVAREAQAWGQLAQPWRVTMGPRGSGRDSFPEYVAGIHGFQRLQLEALGAPYWMDRYTSADFRLAGLEEDPQLIERVLEGPVQAWLFPKLDSHGPFDVPAMTVEPILLYPVLADRFPRQYRPVAEGRFFELWVRRSLEPKGLQRLKVAVEAKDLRWID